MQDPRGDVEGDGNPPDVERLTRLVAATELLDEPEAVLDDFEPRRAAIEARLKADAPQFRQRSSLGAFLVTRYACAWVPEGLPLRRHAPLTPEGFRKALLEGGLSPVQAEAILGPWVGPEESPPPEAEELPVGDIAGLAERSSTQPERQAALNLAAWSPRDLARLIASARLVDRVRCALPWAPAEGASSEIAVAAADVSYLQPHRRVRLLRGASDPWVQALVDLAETEDALRRSDDEALGRMLEKVEEEPDTADLPERNTRDDLPALGESEASTDPRGTCLGLRPRRVDLHTHPIPGSDVGEGALLAAVRALRGGVVRGAEGRATKDVKSRYWNRRLEALACAARGELEAAAAELEPTDPERRWIEPLRLRAPDVVPKELCRRHAADLMRDVTASLLLALGGELASDAE